MLLIEVAIYLLREYSLVHLGRAVEGTQRLYIECYVGFVVAHLLERLNEDLLPAVDLQYLLQQLDVEHGVTGHLPRLTFLILKVKSAEQSILDSLFAHKCLLARQGERVICHFVVVFLRTTARIKRRHTASLGQERLLYVNSLRVILGKYLIRDVMIRDLVVIYWDNVLC